MREAPAELSIMSDNGMWNHLKHRSNWNCRPRAAQLILIHIWDDVPPDMTEAEEDEFWRTHALGDELFENQEPLDTDEAALLERIRRSRAERKSGRVAG